MLRQAWQQTVLISRLRALACDTTSSAAYATRASWGSHSSDKGSQVERGSWRFMQQQGHEINPCNSPLHPAVVDGISPDESVVLSVQEAYTPTSECFGCGEGVLVRVCVVRREGACETRWCCACVL
jgi:hypothetical protein